MHDGGGAKNREQQHLNVASEVSNQGQLQQQRPHCAATPHFSPPYICEQQPKNMCPSNGVQKSARGADVSDEDALRAIDASLGVEEDENARRTNEERLFLEKFNLSPGMPSTQMMRNATPAVTRSVVPAAVAEPPPAQRGGMLTKFSYEMLSGATNLFDTRLGRGGFGSVFQGTLVSGTKVAVKRLEPGPAGYLLPLDQMETEVLVLSSVQHPNIVQLLGSSMDGVAPCLVYALMEGGSLQDRLACNVVGVGNVPLTANKRITVLADVARGLAYLHSSVHIIHRDVKSANILLDKFDVGRIGDFGISKALTATNSQGVKATHMQTQNVVGTLVYMAPEYLKGKLSFKVDAFAFGLVVLETLTGYSIHQPAAEFINLHYMFEEELDTADKFVSHLDKRVSWREHKAQHVGTLYSIADQCLEANSKRRADIVSLIPKLEQVCREIEALETKCPVNRRECCMCFEGESEVAGWMMLRQCGHVVCRACCVGLAECPTCRAPVEESYPVYL